MEAARLQQKLKVGQYLPTVGIGAGYMYHNLLDKDRPFGMVFATVAIPISDWWGGLARHPEAKASGEGGRVFPPKRQ